MTGTLRCVISRRVGAATPATSQPTRQAGPNNGEIFMAWKGVEGDQGIWWSRLDGDTWTAPRLIKGANTSFRPALATIGN